MSYRVRLPLLWLPLLLCQAAYAQPTLLQGNKTGEQVYKTVCLACHETGVAHAPKVGDRAAWAPLIEEGQHVLTGHAWVGVRAMPVGTTEITRVRTTPWRVAPVATGRIRIPNCCSKLLTKQTSVS
ncbi:MAG: c-type cytochrome [Propionivibrio sp.]|nr:c-type cytochrome [Propionivibrio sp.]